MGLGHRCGRWFQKDQCALGTQLALPCLREGGGAGLGFSQTSLLPRHASSAAAPAACPQWAPPTPTCSAPISPPSSDFSWSHVSVVLSPGGGEGLTESLSLTKLQPGSTEQSSQLGPDV